MTTIEPVHFPKRAVVTSGMPYGNKELHFGHVGGMIVHADVYARFLRDRIGPENVLFVSGTDCYGSPIVESHRIQVQEGKFQGSIEEFVGHFHALQRQVLNSYNISFDLFGASALGRTGEVHRLVCGTFFDRLKSHGHLKALGSSQFFDTKLKCLLNGRQVLGKCPVVGCKSEKAYADECSLGHPYEPKDLLFPKSALSGESPEIIETKNWYIDTPKFQEGIKSWLADCQKSPASRSFMISGVQEFLEPPTLYIKKDNEELFRSLAPSLPEHKIQFSKNQILMVIFNSLETCKNAAEFLSTQGVRFREGKTLVPFRLTGNVNWGLPVPQTTEAAGNETSTFWVWPESLWAPISFTAAYLESKGLSLDSWRQWWADKDARSVQFIGEDNLYFYSIAELSMFLGDQGDTWQYPPPHGSLQGQDLVVNNHILNFDTKASSSGEIKPPLAKDLLNFYTSDQLRAHFMSLALGAKSVSFKPKPLSKDPNSKEGDPVLKEGNLLSNAFNKAVRSCFYAAHKYLGGLIPSVLPSELVMEQAQSVIKSYESLMFRRVFHEVMSLIDVYIRDINKHLTHHFKVESGSESLSEVQLQALADAFQMVRTATALLHPIAPEGTEKIREYFDFDPKFWSWNTIHEPLLSFIKDPLNHKLKELEFRMDFFPKHPSQI